MTLASDLRADRTRVGFAPPPAPERVSFIKTPDPSNVRTKTMRPHERRTEEEVTIMIGGF